jgi:regulatory protein
LSSLKIEIKPHEWRKELFVIWIDDEIEREIHTSIFGKKPSLPTQICLTLTDWKEIFDQWEYKRVKNYVIWRLSAQSYHSEQLKKLLKEKLVQSKTIQKVMQEMACYLNDEDWIASFMRTYEKKLGLRAILVKLQSKGLSQKTLNQIKEQWDQPVREREGILYLLQHRYQRQNLNDYLIRRKIIMTLMRKGYSYDQIELTIKEFISE